MASGERGDLVLHLEPGLGISANWVGGREGRGSGIGKRQRVPVICAPKAPTPIAGVAELASPLPCGTRIVRFKPSM